MSYTVQRRQVPAQLVAYASATASLEELQDVLGDLFPRVMRHVMEAGGQISGPPFTLYKTAAEPMDIEAGMPIAEPVPDGEGVEVGMLPAGEVLITVHVGPYDDLEKAYDALMDAAEENDLEPTGEVWEVYWTDPGEEPDADNWKTEVFMPLKS